MDFKAAPLGWELVSPGRKCPHSKPSLVGASGRSHRQLTVPLGLPGVFKARPSCQQLVGAFLRARLGQPELPRRPHWDPGLILLPQGCYSAR